jgi:hypothetical protein
MYNTTLLIPHLMTVHKNTCSGMSEMPAEKSMPLDPDW